MEVLLFALFFISALIFFIAGKDDFGRTENKLIIKEEKNIKEEGKVLNDGNKEDKVDEEKNIESQEGLKEEGKVLNDGNKEDKVAEEKNIESQEGLKKES